jgi:hypothetical protein
MNERLCQDGCGQVLPADRKLRRCRDCHREYSRWWREHNREHYREYHRQWQRGVYVPAIPASLRCARCAKRKPFGRSSQYCYDCERRYRREIAWNPNRRCSGCRAQLAPGRLNHYCTDCARAVRAARYQRSDRPCSGGCGNLMPKGSRTNRCRACQKAYREANRHKIKLCSECRDLVPAGWVSYRCRDCESIRGVEKRNRRRAERDAARAAGDRSPAALRRTGGSSSDIR